MNIGHFTNPTKMIPVMLVFSSKQGYHAGYAFFSTRNLLIHYFSFNY